MKANYCVKQMVPLFLSDESSKDPATEDLREAIESSAVCKFPCDCIWQKNLA